VHAPEMHLPKQQSESASQLIVEFGGMQHVPLSLPSSLHTRPMLQQSGAEPKAVQPSPFVLLQASSG
jgi:hypothetical protein